MKYPTPDVTIESGADIIPLRKTHRQHWTAQAKEVLRQAWRQWEFFTVDDLNQMMVDRGEEPGNFGPLLTQYRRKRMVYATGAYLDLGNGPKQVWGRQTARKAS